MLLGAALLGRADAEGALMRGSYVGRDREFNALRDSLDDALDQRPRIVLCEGNPESARPGWAKNS